MQPKNTAAKPTSMIGAMLSGTLPSMPEPAPGSVHQHSIDDRSPSQRAPLSVVSGGQKDKPRDFTASDKALIRRVHGYMAPLQLLGVLNERLTSDQGAGVVLYTIEQLRAEIASVTTAVPAGGDDWGSLRKLIAKARRDGVLAEINEERINDFAIVFSLTQKQLMTIKDVLLTEEEQS